MISMLAEATLATNARAQEPKLNLKQVKNDLYEIEGDGGNVAVYLTEEGVILVDDKFERAYEGIMFGWATDGLQMKWSLPGMMKELKADR